MDLIFMNEKREDIGVLQNYSLDLAFGADENNFECQVQADKHCCKKDYMLYMEGTEYGGIVDGIGVDTESNAVTYSGRTWHGILGSKVILPLMAGEQTTEPPEQQPEEPEEQLPKLPEGYTEIEYIESSGTQHIDTGFKPNQDTRVVMDCDPENGAFFGVWRALNDLQYILMTPNKSDIRYHYNNSYKVGSGTLTGRHILDADKNNVYFDGALSATMTYAAFQCTHNLYLCALNQGGTPLSNQNAIMKIYSCQIYDNGVLIRDYVPCINESGEIGLYDLVNGVFYGNAGTGEFTTDEKSIPLPDGYQRLTHIESTGTQYIDSGFCPDNNTKVEMQLQFNETPTEHAAIFGVRAGSNTKQFWCYNRSGTTNYVHRYGSSTSNNTAISCNLTDKTTVAMDKNTLIVNGESKSCSAETFTSSYSLFLFAVSASGSAQYQCSYKLYDCKIYDNGTLVRNFVPCVNANGTTGLFDLVGKLFYGNSGTGVFVAGEVIEKPEDPQEPETPEEPEEPENETDFYIIAQNSEGESFVDRYLVIAGDVHECIRYILHRCGLSTLFSVPETASGINIAAYQFDRFTDAYKGLKKMLASVDMLLHFSFDGGTVILSAIPKHDYSKDEEFDSDLVGFEMQKQQNRVNHLICLGSGELENRLIRHLYVDADGNISETQTFFGLEEYTAVYDYASCESEEELLKDGREHLKELHETDSLKIDFEAEDDLYNVGDIVGAVDNITGISIAAEIVKKIVTIKDGVATISYEVGD